MKHLLISIALACIGVAHADTIGPAYLYKGTSVLAPSYATIDLCEKALAAGLNAKTYTSGATYTCRSTTIRTIMVAKQPVDQTRTATCAAPTTGTWPQTSTYTYAGGWVQGPWLPTAAPAGTCIAPPPPPPPVTSWTFLANERASFTLTTPRTVRFGWRGWEDVGSVWTDTKTLAAGTYVCGFDLFQKDPKPGSSKTCEANSAVDIVPVPVDPPPVDPPASSPTPMPISPFVPIVAASKWPKAAQNPVGGWSQDMLIPTTEQPAPSDIGAFRTGCQAVKFGYFDPIVYPGKENASHLHVFFGNVNVNPSSTGTSLFAGGNSTCRGGTINRSAYWVPAMIDMRTGMPIAPMFESNFYYKTGYAVPPSVIAELPIGLRMIAGDAGGTPSHPSSAAIYSCVWEGGNSNWSNSIPDCPAIGNSWLIMGIDFPQCWDGVNLDSPDHKSHMTNPVNVKANNTGNCPVSHPVALPQIAYQILYWVTASGQTKNWRLASDNYDNTQPAGYSGHGDYLFAWKPEIVKIWTAGCDRAQKDCHAHLLSDGRAMVIP